MPLKDLGSSIGNSLTSIRNSVGEVVHATIDAVCNPLLQRRPPERLHLVLVWVLLVAALIGVLGILEYKVVFQIRWRWIKLLPFVAKMGNVSTLRASRQEKEVLHGESEGD